MTRAAHRFHLQSAPLQLVCGARGFGTILRISEIRTGDPLQTDYNLPFFYEPTFTSDGLTPAITWQPAFLHSNASQAPDAGVTSQDWNPAHAVYDEWNLNLEYQLSVADPYLSRLCRNEGNASPGVGDRNQIPTPQATFDQSLRPYPKLRPIRVHRESRNSNYHAFPIQGGEA